MIELSTANLVAYSAQILVVVSLGAIGARVLDAPSAGARLAFWRAILAACLILPFVPLKTIDVVFSAAPSMEPPSAVVEAVQPIAGSIDAADPPGVVSPWRPWLPWLLTMGMVARGLWLCAGLISLRRLRRESEPAELDDDVDVLRRALAPRADVRWHSRIAQPSTFGVSRAVILLPPGVGDLSLDAQRAVVCHELLHVARRDWLWMVVEQVIQCVFWFHPAVWWAIAQIQLSREQAIDHRVVTLIGARRSYMAALLQFADARPALAPAIPFIRRRHLMSRLRELSKEHRMSRLRIVVAAAALLSVIGLSAFSAVSAFPIDAREAIVMAIPPGPVQNVQNVEHVQAAETPAGTQQIAVQVQPGQPPLSVEQLQRIGEAMRKMREAAELRAKLMAQLEVIRASATPATVVYRVEPTYPDAAKGHDVDATVTLRVTIGAAGEVTAVEAVRTRLSTDRDITDPAYWASQPSRAFVQAAEDAIRQWRFEPREPRLPFEIVVSFDWNGGQPWITARTLPPPPPPPPPPPALAVPPPPPPPPPGGTALNRVRVGGNIRAPAQVAKSAPIYPEAAKAARVAGVVILQLVIGTDGSVVEAHVLRSIPLLDQAALDAVYQWKYEPTLLNGVPTEVVATVTVNFTLPPDA